MFRKTLQKGNVHRSDYLRALLSDTMPGDIPIIVSNDGTYKNLKTPATVNPSILEFANKVFEPSRSYTVPYRYNILKSGGGARRLSLIHPASQIDVAAFYRDSGHLICYYARRSQASLRAPHKTASMFFVRGPESERNAFKAANIDTVSLDEAVAHPASYFAYRGYSRAYQFFASSEYLRLEKKYRSAIMTDVSKCFSSIYTHTMYWAIVDTLAGKDNTKSDTFSNRFDRLMQAMNFNETNGICVGSEVSRVFAELILGEIDRRVIYKLGLSVPPLRFRHEYEFYRYVDDFYIFADSSATANKVLAAIASILSDFNLHLNSDKTLPLERPFITQKSRVIRDANINITTFCDRFLASGSHDGMRYVGPLRIWRSSSLLTGFLESVKSSAYDHSTGYQSSSDYVISALCARIANLTATYEVASRSSLFDLDHYLPALLLLLESAFFFYNVNPTVSSSHKLARAVILAARFIRTKQADRYQMLAEQVTRWTSQILDALRASSIHYDADCVPLETLNVLLILAELEPHDGKARTAIGESCHSVSKAGYFEIVTYLYCMKDRPEHAKLRDQVFKRARDLISSSLGVRVDAEAAHLMLDLISCPFLDRTRRASFFNNIRKTAGLAVLPVADAIEAVKSCEDTPWFVDWKETDLLRLIRKKELSSVY